MRDSDRLAVLIDADNTSPKLTREMFEELASYGTLTVKRAYGDWTQSQLNGWKNELHRHAISPMQQFANTSGKNSTDSALIIDAMDLLYAGNLDGFVIVSSDADFTRLATRLRESGMTVYGLGQRKTPKPFQDACDKFTFLEVLRDADQAPARARGASAPDRERAEEPVEEPVEGDDPAPVAKGNLQSMVTKALNKIASDDDEWSSLGALGSHLNRTDPSFDARTYGFARLSDLVRAQPFVETRTVETSSGQGQLWVRLKGRQPAKATATKRSSRRSTTPPAEPAEQKITEQKTAENEAPEKQAPAKRSRARKAPAKKAPEAATEAAVEAAPEATPEGGAVQAEPAERVPAKRSTTRKPAARKVSASRTQPAETPAGGV